METTRKRSWSSSFASTRSTRSGGIFEIALLEAHPGHIAIRVSGAGAEEAFAEEAGGHRWQRIPPNDRRGRVQTSTITIAVLAESAACSITLDARDLAWRATRGSGAGGQKRNKTSSAIDLVHVPTGVSVHCETERSQHRNRSLARERLAVRLDEAARAEHDSSRARERRAQVGSGMRGDKRRTIRCQDGVVVDHPTGRTWRLERYVRGEI